MKATITTKKDSRYPANAPFNHEDYAKAMELVRESSTPITMAEAIAKAKASP